MIFDPATGCFTLDNTGTVLGPALTRAAFLIAPEGRKATRSHRSYCFDAAGGTMFLALLFGPQHAPVPAPADLLSEVYLCVKGPNFGGGWDSYSLARETATKDATVAWLVGQGLVLHPQSGPDPLAELLPEEIRALRRTQVFGTYPWGSASAGFDPREGTWSTVVRYPAWGTAAS